MALPQILAVKGTASARFQNNLKLKYLSFIVSKSTNGVLEFATSCRQLEKLSAFCLDIDRSAFDKLLICIIRNSATLKVLCIENCGPGIISYESIRLIVTSCQGLTDLNIAGIEISQRSMNFICANLTTGIEKLDISQNETFGDDQLKKILTRSTRLTELSFFDTNVSNESVDLIIQNQTLTKLEVSYSNFSFPNLLKLASMPNLKVLHVESGLPTNKKEELLKTLPHLSDSFERKKGQVSGCNPANVPCFCESLCIAFPYQSCVHQLNGFWEIEAKLRYY